MDWTKKNLNPIEHHTFLDVDAIKVYIIMSRALHIGVSFHSTNH